MPRLNRVKDREALGQSSKIVWEKIPHRRGLSIGYRSSSGTWFARAFAHGKLVYANLGSAADVSYSEAVDKAEAWFKRERGTAPRGYDLMRALEDYAITKTANLAHPQAARVWGELSALGKHLSGEMLGEKVENLSTYALERWRDALPGKPATKIRLYTTLAAALSNAHRLHGVGQLRTWRSVATIEIDKEDRARAFIPTDAEVAALLSKCQPDFAALVRAAVLTGCRYGELAQLEVRDFDTERGLLALRVGKTGSRDCLLSSEAVAFFRRQAKGKLPHARLFTTASGEPWGKSMQDRRMREATRIRAFVFYSLRHYALSRQLAAGIPSVVVARNAGTSEEILRRHYHKATPANRDLFDRVPALG